MTRTHRSAFIALAAFALGAFSLSSQPAHARPGASLWSAPLNANAAVPPTMLMARDGSGTVYACTRIVRFAVDGTPVYTFELAAFNESTGQLIWKKPPNLVGPSAVTGITTLPGLVAISVSSPTDGFLVQAYTSAAGTISWQVPVPRGRAMAIAASSGQVVAAGDLGGHFHVRAFTARGVVSWQYTDAATASGASVVTIDGSRALVGGYPGFVMRAFDLASGAVLFTHAETSTLGQIYDIASSGTRAYAAGQSIAGTPLLRAYDLSTGKKAWDAAASSTPGTAASVALAGGGVVTTGYANRTNGSVTTADLFTELRTASGVQSWIDQVDAGGFDRGNYVAVQGNRIYVSGDLTNTSGKQDALLRAYGFDGYVHWQSLSPAALKGNSGGGKILPVAKAALFLSYLPGGNNSFFATLGAFDATAAGPKDTIEQSCTENSAVISVASLPGQAFSLCQMYSVPPQPNTSSISAWDIQTGKSQWTETPTLPDRSPVYLNEVAATPGFVVAVGTASGKSFVRAYAPPAQGTSAPKVLWTDVGASSSEALHVAAGSGYVVASMTVNNAQVVKAYDLSVASSNACWSNLAHPQLGKPCVKWIDTRPEYTRAGVVTLAPATPTTPARAAVAPSGNAANADAIVYTLSSGVATKYAYPLAPSGSGLPYAVVLTSTGVFTAGSGYRGPHTYYATGYQLATPAATPWFDDAPLRGEITIDARGLTAVGTRVYGCGYSLTKPVLRAYTATTGALSWELKPAKWPDIGMCFAVAADATHVFMGGTDGTEARGGGNLLLASVNASTGADEWVVRDTAPGSVWDVERQGDRLVVGASKRFRIYEAICSVHGVEAPCP